MTHLNKFPWESIMLKQTVIYQHILENLQLHNKSAFWCYFWYQCFQLRSPFHPKSIFIFIYKIFKFFISFHVVGSFRISKQFSVKYEKPLKTNNAFFIQHFQLPEYTGPHSFFHSFVTSVLKTYLFKEFSIFNVLHSRTI